MVCLGSWNEAGLCLGLSIGLCIYSMKMVCLGQRFSTCWSR